MGIGSLKNMIIHFVPYKIFQNEHMDPGVTETYMGEWKNDKRSGFGISERSDGLKYEGEWFGNKKYGYGVTTFSNGEKEEGKYKNNVLITSQKKKHLFLMRSAKFRERIDAAVNAAQRASKMALQKADISITRTATARGKAEQADIAAAHAREDSDIAQEVARQYAPDFKQPGLERLRAARDKYRDKYIDSSIYNQKDSTNIPNQINQMPNQVNQIPNQVPHGVPNQLHNDLSVKQTVNQIPNQIPNQLSASNTTQEFDRYKNSTENYQQHSYANPGAQQQNINPTSMSYGVQQQNTNSYGAQQQNTNPYGVQQQQQQQQQQQINTSLSYGNPNIPTNPNSAANFAPQINSQQTEPNLIKPRNSLPTTEPNPQVNTLRRQSRRVSGDRPYLGGLQQQSSIDHFDHYKRPPSRDSSVDRYSRATRMSGSMGSRQPSVDRNSRPSETPDRGIRAPSAVRGTTPAPGAKNGSILTGNAVRIGNDNSVQPPFEEIILRKRGLGQDIIPSPNQPKRTESLFVGHGAPAPVVKVSLIITLGANLHTRWLIENKTPKQVNFDIEG